MKKILSLLLILLCGVTVLLFCGSNALRLQRAVLSVPQPPEPQWPVDDNYAEKVYLEQQAAAVEARKAWKGNPTRDSFPSLWDLFEPFYNCPRTKERVGDLGDGGKWICGLQDLRPPCVIYSFGSSAELGFELAIKRKTNCSIYVFDPTMSDAKVEKVRSTKEVSFLPVGLGPVTRVDPNIGPVATLRDIMARLNHTYIDILKVDIEGSEWSSFEEIFGHPEVFFDQLLIELHHHSVSHTLSFFEGTERHHFRIFSKEPNLYGFLYHPKNQLFEYGFIRESKRGRLAGALSLPVQQKWRTLVSQPDVHPEVVDVSDLLWHDGVFYFVDSPVPDFFRTHLRTGTRRRQDEPEFRTIPFAALPAPDLIHREVVPTFAWRLEYHFHIGHAVLDNLLPLYTSIYRHFNGTIDPRALKVVLTHSEAYFPRLFLLFHLTPDQKPLPIQGLASLK